MDNITFINCFRSQKTSHIRIIVQKWVIWTLIQILLKEVFFTGDGKNGNVTWLETAQIEFKSAEIVMNDVNESEKKATLREKAAIKEKDSEKEGGETGIHLFISFFLFVIPILLARKRY